jgi:hypothetical protein
VDGAHLVSKFSTWTWTVARSTKLSSAARSSSPNHHSETALTEQSDVRETLRCDAPIDDDVRPAR